MHVTGRCRLKYGMPARESNTCHRVVKKFLAVGHTMWPKAKSAASACKLATTSRTVVVLPLPGSPRTSKNLPCDPERKTGFSSRHWRTLICMSQTADSCGDDANKLPPAAGGVAGVGCVLNLRLCRFVSAKLLVLPARAFLMKDLIAAFCVSRQTTLPAKAVGASSCRASSSCASASVLVQSSACLSDMASYSASMLSMQASPGLCIHQTKGLLTEYMSEQNIFPCSDAQEGAWFAAQTAAIDRILSAADRGAG